MLWGMSLPLDAMGRPSHRCHGVKDRAMGRWVWARWGGGWGNPVAWSCQHQDGWATG